MENHVGHRAPVKRKVQRTRETALKYAKGMVFTEREHHPHKQCSTRSSSRYFAGAAAPPTSNLNVAPSFASAVKGESSP